MGGFNHLQPHNKKNPQIARKRPNNRGGFTIVETMIVLAVTGVIFISAVTAVSGRQGKTQFNQAVNAAKTQIEQIIGEVQAGHYPHMGNMSCRVGTASEGGDTNMVIGTGSVGQGSNDACVFLGKVIHFGDNNDPQKIGIYTLAGLRDAPNFASAKPTVVEPSTEFKNLQFGLSAVAAPATSSGAIAVVTPFGNAGPAGASTETIRGTSGVNIIPIPGIAVGSADANARATINTTVRSQSPASGNTVVCYKSGTTAQSGRIVISSGGAVTLEIKNSEDCS